MRWFSQTIFLLTSVFWLGAAGLWGQIHQLEPAHSPHTETGVPRFLIRGTEALGLSTSPTDLHLLPDGRVLVFAQQTMAIGDGTRWMTFRQAPDEAPLIVSRVAVAVDGTIYAGAPGGLARLEIGEDQHWRTRMAAQIPGPEPGTFVNGPREVIDLGDDWLWHSGSGPIHLWRPGQTVRTVGQTDAVDHAFAFRGSHYLSNRTTGELWRLQGGRMERVPLSPTVWVNDTLTCSLPFDEQHLLVGSFRRGLQLFDGEHVTPFVAEGLLASPARINALCPAGEGLFAAAVDNVGIVFFDRQGRIVQVLDRNADYRLSFVRRLLPGSRGVIWGLLKDGIVRVNFPSRLSDFVPLFGAPINTANVGRYHDQLWFMADGQIYRGVYDQTNRLSRLQVDSPPEVYTSSLSYAGGYQFAGTNRGSYYWTPDGWVCFAPQTNNLRVVQAPPVAGRWLYLAQHEIGWLQPTATGIEREAFAAPALDHLFQAEYDAAGDYWIEMGNSRVGRVQLQGGIPHFTAFGPAEGLAESWCQLFVIDGVVRVNVAGRTLRFEAATQRFVADTALLQRFPQFRELGCRPGRDARGRLWLVADNTLHILRETPTGYVADPDERLFSGRVPLYFAFEPDGSVWMQEDYRLLRYDPNIPEPAAAPVRAHVTHVSLPASERLRFPQGGTIPTLSYTDNSLVTHFVALEAPLEASVTFEVKLAGADTAWNAVGSSGSAAFKNLPEGTHQLSVRPRIGDQIGQADTLTFAIRPPWYRTRTAYLAYVVFGLGLIVAISRLTTFMQRRERRRLEQLVGERTQELHATNAQLARQLATIRTLSQAIDQSPTAVALTRPDGTLSYTNPRFCALCGQGADALAGRPVRQFYRFPDETAATAIAATLSASKSWHGQLVHQHPDGRQIPVRAAHSPILADDGTILSHLILEEDISEWLSEQERRQGLEAQLFQAQKLESLGTLAGGIAHDFNNILTAILGCCELAQLSTAPTDPNAELLREIRTSGLRARDLVVQILTFSRKNLANLAPVELAAIVADALKLVRASTPATIKIAQELAPGSVYADATQIYQVVVNLCTNAAQAIGNRPGRISVAVQPCTLGTDRPAELHKLAPGPYLRLLVADTGHGMDATTRQRIFDPFFTTKPTGEGTGLGLSIVQGIVAAHHGALTVQSTVGEGTTFELYFPRTAAAPLPADTTATPTAGGQQEILVVDDEPSIAKYVTVRLRKLGYRATAFGDSREALATVQQEPTRFQAIVTDLTMPHMTGVELLQRLHREGPSLPSIIITGYNQDFARTQLETLPRCVVLQKPFTGEDLSRALAQLLPPASG